jgi:hypothetical protein
MRTLKILLSTLALVAPLAVTAQELEQRYKDNLHSLEDECYAQMKFNFPTKTLVKEMEYLAEDLGWDKYIIRRFTYTVGLCESGGTVSTVSKDGEDFGFMGVHENNGVLDDYWRISKVEPLCNERDLANPDKGYLITCIVPLRAFNTVARHYEWGYQWRVTPGMSTALREQRIMLAMEEIVRRWNGGPDGHTTKRHLTELHWQRFKYAYTYCITMLEEEGFACGYSPMPGRVLRPSNWKD